MKIKLNNITIIGKNINVKDYTILTKAMKNYFSSGLVINIAPTSIVEYLTLSNDSISSEQLFTEYWNFREKAWFTLPKALIKSRHLSII